MRRRAALTAAAVLALAACSHPAAKAPAFHAAQVGTAADVPWSKLGPGWVLALTTTTPSKAGEAARGFGDSGTQTFSVVDPAGGRYQLASIPHGLILGLLGWSPDGRTAVVTAFPDEKSSSVTELIDVTTGAVRPVATTVTAALQGKQLQVTQIAFLAGGGLLVGVQDSGGSGLTGVYRTDAAGNDPVALASDDTFALTPDGKDVLLAGSFRLVDLDGKPVRTLAQPSVGDCSPFGFDGTAAVFASCHDGAAMWRVPLDGSPATRVTADAGADGGYFGAERTGSTVVVQDFHDVQNPCPYDTVDVAAPGGATSPLTVPGFMATGQHQQLVGSDGRRALVIGSTPCGTGESLLWVDPVSGKTQVLFGPGVTTGGVVSAVAR